MTYDNVIELLVVDAVVGDASFFYDLYVSSIGVSLSSVIPSYESHLVWFADNLIRCKVIMFNGLRVGYLRFDKSNFISIAVKEEYRNKGIASFVLKSFGGKAIILDSNVASVRAFERAGWVRKGLYYEKKSKVKE